MPYSLAKFYFLCIYFTEYLFGGNANSAGKVQTAPSGADWSGSILFAFAILLERLVYEILGHLLYFGSPSEKVS